MTSAVADAPEAPEVQTPVEMPVVPLNLQDRCDRCAAQAFVRVFLLNQEGHSTSLQFCGHHFSSNETNLRTIALDIQDERDKINEKPSPSANSD